MKPKIDEIRLIPAGVKVWSIAIQKNVIYDRDVIVKITNLVYGDDNWVFGKTQTQLGAGLLEDHNGDISFNYSETLPHTPITHINYLDFKYNK